MPIFGKPGKTDGTKDDGSTEVKDLQSKIETLSKENKALYEQLSSYKKEEAYNTLISNMKSRAEKLGFTGDLTKIIDKNDSELEAYDKIVENLEDSNNESLKNMEEKSKILESQKSTPSVNTQEQAWDHLESLGYSAKEAVLKAPEMFPEIFSSKED